MVPPVAPNRQILATPSPAGEPAGSPQLPLASRLPPGRGPAVNPREMKTERSEGKNGEILGAQAVLNENSTKRDAERRFRISTEFANRIRTRNEPGRAKKPPCGKTAIVSPRPETVARKKLRFPREPGLPVPKRLEPELSSSGSGGRDRRPCFGGSGRRAGGRGRRSRQGLPKRDPRTPKMGPEDSQNAPRRINNVRPTKGTQKPQVLAGQQPNRLAVFPLADLA